MMRRLPVNDPALLEFQQLMLDYELMRSSLSEHMLPYYDCHGELRVPQIEHEAALLEQELLVAKTALAAATNTPELQNVQFGIRRQAALDKWNAFEALVERIVKCEYQKRHYTPVVQDTAEFGVKLHFDLFDFPTIVTSSPVRVAQCTLKQALLNGPFTSYSQ